MLKAWLVCSGGSCDSSGEDPLASALPTQTSPPPPYFVSTLPPIPFGIYQDYIIQDMMVIDTQAVTFGDEGKIV